MRTACLVILGIVLLCLLQFAFAAESTSFRLDSDPTIVLLGNGDRLPIKSGQAVRLQEGRLLFALAEPLRPEKDKELSLFLPYVAAVFLAVLGVQRRPEASAGA